MTDYERLTQQSKAILAIKMDGHIEAAVAAARRFNLGLSECLALVLQATIRELRAYDIPPAIAQRLWEQASSECYSSPPPAITPAIN